MAQFNNIKQITGVYLTAITLISGCNSEASSTHSSFLAYADNKTLPLYNIDTPLSLPAASLTEQQALYLLLVAELSAQRKLPQQAMQYYSLAATLTQDAAVAQEATQTAIEFESPAYALQGSQLWAKVAPQDNQAQMVAATLLLNSDPEAASLYLIKALQSPAPQLHEYFADLYIRLSDEGRKKFSRIIKKLAKEQLKLPYAQLVEGQLYAQEGKYQHAEESVDRALNLQPRLLAALQLKARLLRLKHHSDLQPLDFLSTTLQHYPDFFELRLFYAEALIDARQFQNAVIQLKTLVKNNKMVIQAHLLLSEAFFKLQNWALAKDNLSQVLKGTEFTDNAKFLMAQIFEAQKLPKDAIDWYMSINEGPYHIIAYLKAASLMALDGKYVEALDILHASSPSTMGEQKELLLSEIDILLAAKQMTEASRIADLALAALPNDVDLLYSHSLVASELKNWPAAEADLKKLLDIDPHHLPALNSLGYILVLQNRDLNNAKLYLTQALSLNPNNPQVLDSLGWLYFQTKDFKQALYYATAASKLSDDSEIATHLGEILWTLGDKDQAMIIWKTALLKTPKHAGLLGTLDRLKIPQ